MAPMRRSWVDIPKNCDWSIDNIPFGVCSFPNVQLTGFSLSILPIDAPRCCTAIGEYAVDLHLLAEAGLLDDLCVDFHPRIVFSRPTLNDFMATNKSTWVAVRNRLISLFVESDDTAKNHEIIPDSRLKHNISLRNTAMQPLESVKCHLPANIGDYTDFYSSREHATNVGIMFRGRDNALQPNWLHMPIGYHGRSSSIFASGSGGKMATIRRPCGQLQLDANDPLKGSIYGPCKLMDFELEVAFFVGGAPNYDSKATQIGRPMTLDEAKDRIFGYVLMNDWSARDIQKWEYVPLGPFTSKNFAATISPWIVTPMALEPFRCDTSAGKQGGGGFDTLSGQCEDPEPLEYLQDPSYGEWEVYRQLNEIDFLTRIVPVTLVFAGSYDVNLSVLINPSTTPGIETEVCKSNLKHMYWSSAQQLAHHSVTGCLIKPGDLLASGTISGKEQNNFGSMLELSWKGSREIALDGGETRKFLQDGDAVIMKGWCDKDGNGRVGFGECSSRILPADPFPYEQNCSQQQFYETTDDRFTKFKLRGSMRSSFTKQVSIALTAKNVPCLRESLQPGTHELTEEVMKSPMHHMPTLEFMDRDEPVKITQSIPIIEFLEATFSNQGARLLPIEPLSLAKVKEIVSILNSPIHPYGGSDEYFEKSSMEKRLALVDALVTPYHSRSGKTAGPFAIGTFGPTLADVCLVPQLQDARMLGVELEQICPALLDVEKVCYANIPWFAT